MKAKVRPVRTAPIRAERDQPFSRGLALLKARKILGPSGHVRRSGGVCEVGRFGGDGFEVVSHGPDFKTALKGIPNRERAKPFWQRVKNLAEALKAA